MSSSNEKFEREFEAFMNEEDSRLAALYRKLPQDEPDARLDAAVRSMAHRALNPQLVAAPRAEPRRRRSLRWIPALGTAAGLVLAAGIAYRMGPSLNERNETGAPPSDVISVRPLDAPVVAAPPLSPAPPPAAANLSAPAAGAASAAQGVSTPPSSFTEQAKAEVRKEATEPQRVQNQPADTSSLGKVESAEKPAAQPQAFPGTANSAPAAKQKRASEMDAVERRQTMAAGAWQNLHDRDDQAAATKDSKLEDKRAARAAAPVAAPSAAATQASGGFAPAQSESTATPPPPPAEPMLRSKAAPAAAAAPPPMLQSAPAAPAAARAVGQPEAPLREESSARDDAAAAPAQGQRMRSNDPNAQLYPEHWLANIRTMLKENRRDEARRSLGEFRRMYPEYHLPDDLRDLK
jgi:hypothetical protein